jgi:hydrogenase expression/formation protein HypC
MCLAVPGQIVESSGDEAVVDLQGNRLKISTLLTPEVRLGDWVLVHAGFAITQIEEADALETWDYLRQAYDGPDSAQVLSDAGAPTAPPTPGIQPFDKFPPDVRSTNGGGV